MRNMLTIAGKEIRSYFTSPLAYVVIVFFCGVTGLIFTLGFLAQPRVQAEMLRLMLGNTMPILLAMVTPILTMGLLAQEKASGTMELLMTRPVRDWEIVAGKYLAAVALVLGILAITLEFPVILALGSDLDWGMVLSGYIGLALAAMAFLALGVMASSFTSNQIAAAVAGIFVILFFWIIGWLAQSVSRELGDVLKHISILENLQDFGKGIVDTKAIVFFVTLIGYALFTSVRSLENRRAV